jgi:hypothetical protein
MGETYRMRDALLSLSLRWNSERLWNYSRIILGPAKNRMLLHPPKLQRGPSAGPGAHALGEMHELRVWLKLIGMTSVQMSPILLAPSLFS